MNTIKIEAYTYAELGQTAKEKVQEWINCSGIDDLFDNYEREYRTKELEKLGYEDIDIRYSGFYCQGDGASIACTVNVTQFIKRNKLSKKYASLLYWLRKTFAFGGGLSIKRSTWGHYVHDKLLYADSNDLVDDLNYYNCPAKPLEQLEELEAYILSEVQEKSRELYAWLEAEYDYHFTDEYMIDACDANEYLFDAYGDPVHHLEVE